MTKAYVLDASALLCLLNAERGQERVAEALPDSAISSVNFAEVVAKLSEKGLSAEEISRDLGGLSLDVRPFTADQAFSSGMMRLSTVRRGLSLGDRCCLALAQDMNAIALTSDRDWLKIGGEVRVEVVR